MSDYGASTLGPHDSGLGSYLRHERETKGLTLEQVAASTKITVRVLQALEADHYDDLPAKPFIRGFVTSYCRALQLNGKEVLARYESFLDQRIKSRGEETAGVVGYAFEKKDGERSRAFLWVAMGVFVVFGGVGLLVLKPALKRRQVSHLEQLKAAPAQPAAAPQANANGNPEVNPSTSPEVIAAAGSPAEVKPLDLKPAEAVAPEKAPEKVAEKAPEKPVEKPAEKAPEKSAEPKVFQKVPLVLAPPAPPTPPKVEAKVEPKPEPKLEVKPEVKPENAKVAEAKPEVKPAEPPPAPAAAVASGDSMEPSRKPAPDDGLNKGDALVATEIHQKLVLKSLADVFVRYQVDEKPSMRFALQGGKMLVLRAKAKIQLQVSNPKAVQIRFNKSNEYVSIEKAKSFESRKGNAYVAMSADGSLQAAEIFKELDFLPSTPDPVPGTAPAAPTE